MIPCARPVDTLFFLLTTQFLLANAAGWHMFDPVSFSSGTPISLRSCAWVITQAFDGWNNRDIQFQPGTYTRWGQKECVVEVATDHSFPAFWTTGGIVATALTQTMISAAQTNARGGYGTWRSGSWSRVTVAHSNYFNGDVGYPQRRVNDTDSEATPQRFANLTAADPATNVFAAHLASIDFDALENLAIANLTAELDIEHVESRADAPSLLNCGYSKDSKGDTLLECECSGLDGTYQATCHGQKSDLASWTVGLMMNAVGSLRSQIEQRNAMTDGWTNPTVEGGSHKGAVLFTPKSHLTHPSNWQAKCGEAMLLRAATLAGYTPSACSYEPPYTLDSEWHVVVGDSIA